MSTFTIKHHRKINKSYLNLLILIAFIVVFLSAVNYTQKASLDHQEDALLGAIQRDIVMCYAQNGFYPPSLDYIIEHYGLLYDKEVFFVSYTPVADNIYPNYNIIRLRGNNE